MKPLNCLTVLLVAGLAGCTTLTGNYEVSAKDLNGQPLSKNLRLISRGGGVYSMRNALCSLHPGAIVTITDIDTGAKLTSESPYQCR